MNCFSWDSNFVLSIGIKKCVTLQYKIGFGKESLSVKFVIQDAQVYEHNYLSDQHLYRKCIVIQHYTIILVQQIITAHFVTDSWMTMSM